jgi:hypothetical protein
LTHSDIIPYKHPNENEMRSHLLIANLRVTMIKSVFFTLATAIFLQAGTASAGLVTFCATLATVVLLPFVEPSSQYSTDIFHGHGTFAWQIQNETITADLNSSYGGWIGLGIRPDDRCGDDLAHYEDDDDCGMDNTDYVIAQIGDNGCEILDTVASKDKKGCTWPKYDSEVGGWDNIKQVVCKISNETFARFSRLLKTNDTAADNEVPLDREVVVLFASGSSDQKQLIFHKHTDQKRINFATGKVRDCDDD